MTITYTTLSGEGEMIETGLSLSEAAHAVLTSDLREYDVREADGEFTIWSRQQVANRPWAATIFVSYEDGRDEAEADLFLQVVSIERMRGHCEAITDGQYREMLQQQLDDLQYEDDEAERARLRGEIEARMPKVQA